MTAHVCTHPPFVVNIDTAENLSAQHRAALLDAVFTRAADHPNDPIIVNGATAYVDPIECSWCRNASEDVDLSEQIVRASGRLAAELGVPFDQAHDLVRITLEQIADARVTIVEKGT